MIRLVIFFLLSFHNLAAASPEVRAHDVKPDSNRDYTAPAPFKTLPQPPISRPQYVEEARFDHRLLFDALDVAVLFPKDQFKLQLQGIMNKDWVINDLGAIVRDSKVEINTWPIVGFRLAPCMDNCRLRLIITVQPNGRSLMDLVFNYSLLSRGLRTFVLGLQQIKYDYERETQKTVDGRALQTSPYLEGRGDLARLEAYRSLLQKTLGSHLPDYVVYNTISVNGQDVESRVYASALLDELTAVVKESLDPAAPKPVPLPAVPHDIQPLRESNRTCVGNRVQTQLKKLSANGQLKGYASFSREIPVMCENRRQFGYSTYSRPVISAEVALQAALVAHDLNKSFIDRNLMNGPAMDCTAHRQEAVMCHFLKSPAANCMSMCTFMSSRKADLIEQMVTHIKPDGTVDFVEPRKFNQRAKDLAHMSAFIPSSDRRFLNITCVAPAGRGGDDNQGLALAASIELRGEMGDRANVHVLSPVSVENGLMSMSVRQVENMRVANMESVIRPLNSTNGLMLDLQLEAPQPGQPQPPQGEGRLNLRCVGKEVISYAEQKKIVPGQVAPAARRQSDVYTATEGRDAKGQNQGIVGDDAITESLRRAAKAQDAPKPKAKVEIVSVRQVHHECTDRFIAEFRASLPPTKDSALEQQVVRMNDLSCKVSESNVSY